MLLRLLDNSLENCLTNHRLYLMYNRGGYRHSKGRGVEIDNRARKFETTPTKTPVIENIAERLVFDIFGKFCRQFHDRSWLMDYLRDCGSFLIYVLKKTYILLVGGGGGIGGICPVYMSSPPHPPSPPGPPL